MPVQLYFVDAMPLTAVGKVFKPALRWDAAAARGARDVLDRRSARAVAVEVAVASHPEHGTPDHRDARVRAEARAARCVRAPGRERARPAAAATRDRLALNPSSGGGLSRVAPLETRSARLICEGPSRRPRRPPRPMSPLADFHPAVARWFGRDLRRADRRAGAPPGRQIRAGRHTLVAAPTGSGKTLTAFLAALDGLVRAGPRARRPARRDGRSSTSRR